jgi:hypothetical protein
MEDVMFVHKSKPLALSFAAAAIAVGLAADSAQADRRKGDQRDSYCSAPAVCNQRQIGIIQKERDGVNYFYGGSDVPPPQVTYIYLRDDTVDQPVNISNVNTTNFAAPQYTHQFRMKKDHWKKKPHWKWNKGHPGPFDLPGLNAGGKFMGP